VIEANPSWGSGIYGCDPHKVLEVLERATVWDLSSVDRKWLRYR